MTEKNRTETGTETTAAWQEYYRSCRLCPRNCGANRLAGHPGVCGVGSEMRIARAALHFWEEPCISGRAGSGAVFFCGCPLHCVYCQNAVISGGAGGVAVTVEELKQTMLSLMRQGAHNINLVTAGHYTPSVAEALKAARADGLYIPVVWNSSGYEKPQTLRMLDGLVDVYLPDFKYTGSETAAAWSHASDYPQRAKEALAEMYRQTGPVKYESSASILSSVPKRRGADGHTPSACTKYDENALLVKGVLVRHLLLPGHVSQAREAVKYLLETYGKDIGVSLMSQYTPMPRVKDDPLLGRRVTAREYERLLHFALEHGLENGYMQEGEAAEESFIPSFNGEGVITSGKTQGGKHDTGCDRKTEG